MITIKSYIERPYYRSKYGEKCFIDTDTSGTYLKAAMLTGKVLETDEELLYTATGETEHEANTALKNYLKSIKFNGIISRTEKTEQ